MKNILLFIFFVCTCFIYSQNNPNGVASTSNRYALSLSAGISSPSGTFSDNAYASSGSFFDVSAAYYFSKIGAGVSYGSISNPTEGGFLDASNLLLDPSLSTEITTEDWKTSYIGVGPEFRMLLGSAFEATLQTRFGAMSIKPNAVNASVNFNNGDVSNTIPAIQFGSKEKTSVGYYSAGIKLGYKISDAFGLFFLVNHISSLSKEIEVVQRKI